MLQLKDDALDTICQQLVTMSNPLLSKDLPHIPLRAANSVYQSQPSVKNGTDTPRLEQSLELGDFSIDEYRPFKVIIVGAGFSGIAAGIR